jgi:uncharacterized protein (DUF58 family)
MNHGRGYRFLDPTALARVKNLGLAARGVVEGFISGLHSSPYKGFSSEFAEHRKYSHGDNPRYLDWRILGRTDRLYIKQFEEETNMMAHILLDASGSMAYGHGSGMTKLTYGCYLAAVLGYLLMRQQDAVGLTIFDRKVKLELPARSTPRHLDEMMRQLEGLQPGETTDIASTLTRLAARYKRRCLIVLISDLYDEPEAVERALHHFRHKRHEVILFHILDKAEIEFPFRETATFLDAETGERLLVDPSYVKSDYLEQISVFLERYRRMCADCQIDYVHTDTSVPYDFMLSRFLKKRSRL